MGDDRPGFSENGDSFLTVGTPEFSDEVGCGLDGPISKQDPREIARQYQLELSKRALDENVIVVLETGCGKTLIAILLMCDMGHLIKKPQKNVCVFLAPTVVLVHQQARVIEQFTDFKVGVYCGDAKHLKSHNAWEKEIEQYEVLLMTPQVLLRSLCHCFIRMEMIALLIFDECHYAQIESNHPYAEIMKVFYDIELSKVPRIFGMTASPVCGKGASINSLEALLHAKVYTVNKKEELEAIVVSPVFQLYYYGSSTMLSSNLYQMCLNRLEDIKRKYVSMLCRAVDDASRVQNIKKLLQKLHKNMVFSLTYLGLWGALQACRVLLNDDGYERNELIDVKANTKDDFLQNAYLAEIASLLSSECMRNCSSPSQKPRREELSRTIDFVEGIASDLSAEEVLKEPFFSQKVLRLIGILSNFRSRPDMKCIIFVNRIVVARSLSYILGQIKFLSAWKCDFLVGLHSGLKRMSRRTMSHILEEFRSGKVNLLVATKVGEEGLDIQTCCLVIRFDLPETLASFIQSRGRARMPKSEYAFLVDSENEREMNLVRSFKKDEDRMNMDIHLRKSDNVVAHTKEEVYSVGSTGATISTQASISLLYHYCSKLPRDEYFNPKPCIFYVDDAEGTICNIILPCNAPIHHIASAPQLSIVAAKKDACLKACKELHQIGALTEYLLPEQDDNEGYVTDIQDPDGNEDEDSPFELQEMLIPAALKASWCDVSDVVCLNAYFIRFIPKPHDRQYKDFGLFVKASLPYEAERMKIDLHLAYGRTVLTDLVSSGVVEFNGEELLLAQNFQEMFFKMILDRSEFMRSHVLFKNHEVTESNSSTFYLLLPVIWQEHENRASVDWMVIRRCLSSPVFSPPTNIEEGHIPLGDHLQLADGPVDVNVIVNSLVYVAYKKSFFFVSQILPDKNGYSLHSCGSSHLEYLSDKFGIHLRHPEQPLLQVKQLFSLHNLLHDRRAKRGNSEARDLEEHFFEVPPELCQLKIIGFSKDIGSSLSLLPSVMHRLENLLVAIELKDMLSKSFTEGAVVTAERVLEALTTERCCERFSLERLEVLGDAFLKFAVGRHLFLKYEASDEGQLTRKRSNAVNNSNLCKLAIQHNLLAYIRDREFDPSQFFALGHPCPILCTKQTEKSIHSDSEINLIRGISTLQVRCSKNHHWLSKKTIADVVEALVGAYIVDSGFQAAIAFLRWVGVPVEFDISQLCHAWSTSARFMSVADRIDIPSAEGCLSHMFVHKGLLLQAFIHPSYNRHGGGCYQRLEFLGDAVLDYLITSYLYSAFPDLKPGQLTDLRSSLVNNSSFARVAAIRSLHRFIICENGNLRDAINKYVNFIGKPASERGLLEEPPYPKVLGDLVESCVGAILLDGGFDLNHVWKVMLSFLEPVMTFSTLQLDPVRELSELSQQYGWRVQYLDSITNRSFMVEAIVDGRNFHEVASATNRSKKGAAKFAAQRLISKLKAQGYRLKTKSLEELLKTVLRKEAMLVGYDEIPLSPASSSALTSVENLGFEDHSTISVNSDFNFAKLSLEDHPLVDQEPHVSLEPTDLFCPDKKSPRAASALFKRRQHSQPIGNEICRIDSDAQDASRKSAKSRLNEICVANCWRLPSYDCCKEEGPSHLKMFTFKVMIVIEDAEDMSLECLSQPQAKKKAAAEEAAAGALWFLKKQGYIG